MDPKKAKAIVSEYNAAKGLGDAIEALGSEVMDKPEYWARAMRQYLEDKGYPIKAWAFWESVPRPILRLVPSPGPVD